MKIIITGTTGYVGEGVMLACLDNPEIEKVLSVSRRPTGHSHPKLEEYIVPDFMALETGDPKLQGYDAVFFIAGISSVGLKEEQYVGISHDIPLHFADIVGPKENMTFIYLSGAGNYNSKTQMWVRVKKSTEDALVAMPFKGAYNFRPCIMWRYKGQKRIQTMQYFFWVMYPFFKLVGMWNRMSEVADAMIAVSRNGYHKAAIECKDISKLAKQENITEELKSILEEYDLNANYILYEGNKANINDIEINFIKTSHDAPGSIGFVIKTKDKSIVYITDTGYINNKYFEVLKNHNLYIMESNHDVTMLMEGNYPHQLKKRILGNKGHLSNDDAAYYLSEFIGDKTKTVILAHLSDDNNTYEKALDTVSNVLKSKNKKVKNIIVAKQKQRTELIEV